MPVGRVFLCETESRNAKGRGSRNVPEKRWDNYDSVIESTTVK